MLISNGFEYFWCVLKGSHNDFLLRCFALFLFSLALCVFFYTHIPEAGKPMLFHVVEKDVPQEFVLAFTGDIIIHGSVYIHARGADGEYDFTPSFRYVREDIQQADLAICHLETLISGREGVYSHYPRFQAPRQIADALFDAGFDGCSLASNHAADGGAASVRETVRHFDRVGLKHTGAIGEQVAVAPSLYYLGGKPVAHFSYTYGTNGMPTDGFSLNLIDVSVIRDDVRRFKQEHEDGFVILSLHWGDEYRSEVSAYQQSIISDMEGSGVDLVVGHHAHVVQPVLMQGDMHVLTGLGNFLSAQIPELCNCPEEVQDGVIALVEIVEDGDGFSVSDISLVPTIVDFSDFTILRTEKDAPTEHVTQGLLDISSERVRAIMEKYVVQ